MTEAGLRRLPGSVRQGRLSRRALVARLATFGLAAPLAQHRLLPFDAGTGAAA
jgi:hypothetical protein